MTQCDLCIHAGVDRTDLQNNPVLCATHYILIHTLEVQRDHYFAIHARVKKAQLYARMRHNRVMHIRGTCGDSDMAVHSKARGALALIKE